MRKRRRVVAPATRLGASEEGDLTALAPPQPAPGQRAPAGGERQGSAPPPTPTRPTLPDRAEEDTDEAWGDSAESDAHVLREKPPHWQ